MEQINCHIPITIRVTGRPTDTQYEQLGEALVRSLSERIAFAERTIATRHGPKVTRNISVAADHPADQFLFSRSSPDRRRYGIPSYDGGGRIRDVPIKEEASEEMSRTAKEWSHEQFDTDPAELAWDRIFDWLRGHRPEDAVTAVDYSRLMRYIRLLELLRELMWEAEVTDETDETEPFSEDELVDVEDAFRELSRLIWEVARDHPDRFFPPDAHRTDSGLFLEEWLKDICPIRFVPKGFQIEDFRPPEDNEEEIKAHRDRVVEEFIRTDATRLVELFVLDTWVGTGLSPQAWLSGLSIDSFKERLVDLLTDKFMERASKDTQYVRALRVAALETWRFYTVMLFYRWALDAEDKIKQACKRLPTVPYDDLDDFEIDIASDPSTFYELMEPLGRASVNFLSKITPGQPISGALVEATQTAVSEIAPRATTAIADSLALFRLLTQLNVLMKIVEAEKSEARKENR